MAYITADELRPIFEKVLTEQLIIKTEVKGGEITISLLWKDIYDVYNDSVINTSKIKIRDIVNKS